VSASSRRATAFAKSSRNDSAFVTAHSDALRLTEFSETRAKSTTSTYKAPGLFKLVMDCRESDARDRGRDLYPDFDV